MHSKTEILRVASELFSERGYHGTSMREIGRVLDLRGGSLYAHIKSKEELLWEIVSRAADLFQDQARAVPLDILVEERIALLVRGHLRVMAWEREDAVVFFHEWRFLRPVLREKIWNRRDEYEGYFRHTIEEGVRQGVFQVGDTQLATLFILSVLNWTPYWFKSRGPLRSIEQFADQYVVFILRVLKNR